MQTHSTSQSPSNEAPPLPPANHGHKVVNPTTDPARKPAEKCHWTPAEEECLISFLVSKKSEAGDGGSFKPVTWTAAVQEMAKIPPLHTQYNIVTTLKGLSGIGCKYTTELGMNIGVAEQSVWKEYITKHPASAVFAHKGFVLYDLMSPLMPSLVKGRSVYRPGQGTHGTTNTMLSTLPQDPPDDNALGIDDPLERHGDGIPSDRSNGGHASDGDHTPPPPSSAYPSSSPISPPLPLHTDSATTPDPHSITSASQTATTMVSTSSKHKQSALSASLLTSSKKQCMAVTGAVALNGIKESLDSFNSTIERSLLMQLDRMHSDTSPKHRAKAMDLFQEQESYLSDDCMVAFIDLFRVDSAAADAYIALKHNGLRKAWVQRQMKDLGFPLI
ncbi:hypothetical protein L208DRAFT_1411625 [Tricholoma matsutake]|nr:hypothetical protein L208DRAFT_1411625 [Tricholoma matsutake 945]